MMRMTSNIQHQSIWPILVSKEAAGLQQSHQKIKCWLKYCLKIKELKSASRKFVLYKLWKSFVYFDIFWGKRGQGRWHLPLKSFMFLETVNKNKPGKLRFKVIENTLVFLTNPNNLHTCILALWNRMIRTGSTRADGVGEGFSTGGWLSLNPCNLHKLTGLVLSYLWWR